jgi:anti-anti-sigma regulatory factor
VDVLLEGVDALQRICSPDTAGIADGAIPGLIDRLALIREGRAPAPSRPPEPPPAPPDLHPVAEAGPCCVTLPANLDSAAAESLRKELSAILSARVPRIRLDYSEVRQCGAAFLALLASLAREAARADRPLDIESTGVSGELACLLRTTGLNVALGQGG